MFGFTRKLILFLCFMIVVIATTFSLPAFAKQRFPTRPRANESIEESIARIQYDEARGKRMIAANDAQIRRFVGDKALASYKAGTCPEFRCVNGRARGFARELNRRSVRIGREISGLAQEKTALMAMVALMNAPLAANTMTQPGVGNTQPIAAGSNSSSPMIPSTNPMMPAEVPPTQKGPNPPAVPPTQQVPAADGASY